MRLQSVLQGLLCAALIGCQDSITPLASHACVSVACTLFERGQLTLGDAARADSIIADAMRITDSSGEIHGAIATISSFDSAGLFPDSVRFHRMIDRIAVTVEVARGGVFRDALGRFYPAATPRLAWARIPNRGIHFQPVNTAQHVIYPVPKPWSAPTDTIRAVAEALWRYRIPTRLVTGQIVPMWEYEFPHVSGGVAVTPPWHSGMAQGYALMLFAELYRRTQEQIWKQRAYAVLPSLTTSWDSGGLRLPDTTGGYWFEEYHPTVRVFNGAAHAALHMGVAAQAFPDEPLIQRIARSAAGAILHYAPLYDDGRWTAYSLTQRSNTRSYHDMHIALMRELALQTGDARFTAVADKWAAYRWPY